MTIKDIVVLTYHLLYYAWS